MGSFRAVAPPDTVSVSAMCQGGAALCAFGAGVLIGLTENPRISINQIRGTSMGGLNAAFFAEGYAKGGPQGAIDRLYQQWDNLSKFEKHSAPLWYPIADSANDAYRKASSLMLRSMVHPWVAKVVESASEAAWSTMRDIQQNHPPQAKAAEMLDAAQEACHRASKLLIRSVTHPWFADVVDKANDTAWRTVKEIQQSQAPSTPLKTHPVLDFLDYMERKGIGLDFKALPDWVSINATRVKDGRSVWQSTRDDIVTFKGSEIDRIALAAGGSLDKMMPDVRRDGVLLKDGGYSANPSTLSPPVDLRSAHTAIVEIRARPTGAYPRIDNGEPQTAEEVRGFFNTLTDRDMKGLRAAYPQHKFFVAEPKLGIETEARLKPPELLFDRETVMRRMEAGRQEGERLAAEIVRQAFGETADTPTRRRQTPAVAQAAIVAA